MFESPTFVEAPAKAKRPQYTPLLWAVFLGSSWTWVIGMFLPVLLVRDFGMWGWIVFAVPNVIGAAAMGWVLRDAEASDRFVQRHAIACRAFSLVTIAYHVFFAMWMIERLRVRGLSGWGFITLGVFAIATLAMRGNAMRMVGAIGATVASGVMWWMLYRQQSVLSVPPLFPRGGEGGAWKVACLFPVFAVGFALCPYLDLTFHRARQHTSPAGGRVAFGVGFGVVFLAMIVFTLLYARWLAPAVAGHPLGQLTTLFVTLHFICQSSFTVAAHVRELPRREGETQAGHGWVTASGLILIVAAIVTGAYAATPHTFRGRDLGEVAYWCLLGFYGIVFPVYLLTRGFVRGGATAAVCIAAAFPMYWMGFIERRPIWLLVGVLVVLASRLGARGRTA